MGRRKTGTFATSTLARAILIATLDIIAVAAAFFFALWMRHDFEYSAIPDVYLDNYQRVILPWCAICVLMFTLWKLYSSYRSGCFHGTEPISGSSRGVVTGSPTTCGCQKLCCSRLA